MGSDYVGVNNKIRPGISGSYGVSKSALRVAVEYFRHEYKNAAFIQAVLEKSTDKDYSELDWDYRFEAHHQNMVGIRSKL